MKTLHHGDAEAQRRRLNQLSGRVIGLAMEVHRELGTGLLESAYEEALAHELTAAGLSYERQRETPLLYKGIRLDCGYRIDLLVEGELVVELKAVADLLPVYRAQLLTYLKLERRSLGLLINWHVPVLKDGICRMVSGDLFKSAATNSLGSVLMLLLGVFASLWFNRQG